LDSAGGERKTRAFIAVPVSEETRRAVARLQAELRHTYDSDFRWVKPGNLHITLQFLGDIAEGRKGEIIRALMGVATRFSPLDYAVAGAGAFPSPSRPRVLWCGVSTGGEELRRLQSAVQSALRPLGFPSEKRLWTPHLTLARARQRSGGPDLRRELSRLAERQWGSTSVTSFQLMGSKLSPGGADYSVIQDLRLGPCPSNNDEVD